MEPNRDGTVGMDLENWIWSSEGRLELVRQRQHGFLENLIADFLVMFNPGRIFLKKAGINELLTGVL